MLVIWKVSTIQIYSGKVSDSPSPLVSQFKNNIISSSLVSAEDVTGQDGFAPDFKAKPNDIDVRVVIDYKFKDEIVPTNGENETIFSLRKISDTLGYRIVVFNIVCSDELDVIGEGQHQRFIIDNEKFLAGVNAKIDKAKNK